MADRSVIVRLRAEVGSFKAEMDKAAKAAESVGKKTKDSQEEASGALGKLVRSASEHEQAWTSVGLTMTAAGAGMIAVIGGVVSAYADFDEAMATVAADTRETGSALASLREAAIDAGAATSFSAVEAAQAIDELAKAGVSTADILDGGLAGSMALASAGGLDVAKSAEIASAAMVQFGLGGQDVGHIADLLAAGAGKALGSVEDLGMALNQGGLVAAQMGLSIEETTGTLAAFASAGLKGSDAGTSMKTMLLMLANPSKESAATMKELGVNAYDAAGNFVGMTNLAGQLQQQLSGLTQQQRDQALATIFGSDAIRAANVLYTQGSAGIQTWVNDTNDAGYAAEQTALKLDSLKGDWEYLMGDLDSLALSSGGAVNDMLRDLVQGVDEVVVAFNALPDPIKEGALGMAGIAGAGLLVGGAFLTLAPRALDVVNGFRQLRRDSPEVATGLGKVGKAAGIAGVAFAALAAVGQFMPTTVDQVSSMSEATALLASKSTGIEELNAQVEKLGKTGWARAGDNDGFKTLQEGLENLTDPSFRDRVADFGDTLASVVSGGSLGSKDGRQERAAFVGELEAMGEGLANLASSGNGELAAQQFELFAAAAEDAGMSRAQLLDLMPAYRDALKDEETASQTAAVSAEQVAASITGIAPPSEDAADAIDSLGDALDAILATFFSVDQAADDFQGKLNALSGAAKDNGRDLDGTTDAAISNREALRGTADAAANLILKMAEQGASSSELASKAAELKQNFLDQAAAAGFSGEQVEKVAAAYDAIPETVKTQLLAQGLDETSSKLDGILSRLAMLPREKVTSVRINEIVSRGGNTGGGLAHGSVVDFHADGSMTGTSFVGARKEDHVAQIAPAGAWRVWAEDETGGEAYVPLGEGKRPRSKRIVEEVVRRFGGDVEWYANGGLDGVAPGTTVSRGLLSSAMGATVGPVSAERYNEALARSAFFTKDAEAAERMLARTRERSEAGLDALKEKLDAAVEAQEAAQDAAEEAAAARVTQLREQKASDATIKRAQQEQTDLKKRNAQATKDLKKANEDQIKLRKAENDAAETQAENRLTFAKERAKDATDELRDSEKELAEARQRALDYAEDVASSLTANSGLGALFSDGRIASVREATAALAEAQRSADGAGVTVRGENGAAALSRRAGAVRDLAGAAEAYAKAQAEMGQTPDQIASDLAPVLDRIRDLGFAYGVASEEVDKLTASIAAAGSGGGEDLLGSMEAERDRVRELSASLKELRAGGLNDTSLDEIIRQGTTKGLGLARRILSGGSGYIEDLNGLQSEISGIANGLGADLSAGRYDPNRELKVAPIKIESGLLTVDGGKLALSEAAALDATTMNGLGQIFTAAARAIPPPVVNVTTVSYSFGSAP